MISAAVSNEFWKHRITLSTGGKSHAIEIGSRATGYGSAANGGELLCLALATCYCNDVYREAGKRGIEVHGVDVEVEAEFGAEGEAASHLSYRATVRANAPKDVIAALIRQADSVAEVQNTLRLGMPMLLESFEAISTKG